MLPSSGRVKLNRIPPKEVCTPQLLTRRRRFSQFIKTADLTAADSCIEQIPGEGREIIAQHISEPFLGTTEGTVENALAITSEFTQPTCRAEQRVRETVPAEDASVHLQEGDKVKGSSLPEHDYGGNMLLSKRKYIKCKGRLGTWNDLELTLKVPNTRSRHYQNKPNTRSSSRLKTTLFTRRLQCAWCVCDCTSPQSAVRSRGRELARRRKRFGASRSIVLEKTRERKRRPFPSKSDRTSSCCQARQKRKRHNLKTDASCKVKERERKGQYRVDKVVSARRSPGPLTAAAEAPLVPTDISSKVYFVQFVGPCYHY